MTSRSQRWPSRQRISAMQQALSDQQKFQILVEAVKRIRHMGYDSQACRATETVLACIRVAEDALREVGQK